MDLRREFETERADYLDTIRRQEQQVALLNAIIEKVRASRPLLFSPLLFSSPLHLKHLNVGVTPIVDPPVRLGLEQLREPRAHPGAGALGRGEPAGTCLSSALVQLYFYSTVMFCSYSFAGAEMLTSVQFEPVNSDTN